MDPEAAAKARIATLHQEMDAIHFANKLYWENKSPSREDRAEYHRRQERLQEIRRELLRLES
jgi:hypothetical protein